MQWHDASNPHDEAKNGAEQVNGRVFGSQRFLPRDGHVCGLRVDDEFGAVAVAKPVRSRRTGPNTQLRLTVLRDIATDISDTLGADRHTRISVIFDRHNEIRRCRAFDNGESRNLEVRTYRQPAGCVVTHF
jgi:hypothetical protein